MHHFSIDLIIPTLLSAPSQLAECLRAVQAQDYSGQLTVLVMVNRDEASLDHFLDEFPQFRASNRRSKNLHFKCLGKNTGFTGAVNAGVALGNSPLIVLLNDDAIPEPSWLKELVAAQEKTGAAMVASAIYSDQELTQIDSLGFSWRWRGQAPALKTLKIPLKIDADHWLSTSNRDLLQSEPLAEPFGPDAAAALYTRKLWEKLGGLNKAFFAYLEDVDLALRARLTGETCVVAGNARVFHRKHATSSSQSSFKEHQDFLNWWRIVAGGYPRQAWVRYWRQILLERMRNLSGWLKQHSG